MRLDKRFQARWADDAFSNAPICTTNLPGCAGWKAAALTVAAGRKGRMTAWRTGRGSARIRTGAGLGRPFDTGDAMALNTGETVAADIGEAMAVVAATSKAG